MDTEAVIYTWRGRLSWLQRNAHSINTLFVNLAVLVTWIVSAIVVCLSDGFIWRLCGLIPFYALTLIMNAGFENGRKLRLVKITIYREKIEFGEFGNKIEMQRKSCCIKKGLFGCHYVWNWPGYTFPFLVDGPEIEAVLVEHFQEGNIEKRF